MKRLKYLTLAALLVLPLTACDEGEDIVSPVSGTVTGTVTIDGAGASGITVALSSGQTATTDASGRYTFSSVPAGAYTVALSGVPSGVTFDALAKAAVVSSNGQTVTVDFSGQSIRTSAIIGSVTSGGQPVSGVTLTLGGAGSGTTTTDANGQYSFGGLAAGSYTVTASGLPAATTCPTNPQTTTLAAGETKVVGFSCNVSGTGTISGTLFTDGNGNNEFDTGEGVVEAENVTITLEGPNIGETRSTVTDENGTYSFTDLAPGSYNVCIDEDDADIPDNVEYGGTTTCFTRTLSGGGATVNFPFDIIGQTVLVYAHLGTEDDPMLEPVEGVILDLYPTEADLNAQTNRLDRDTTDANGQVQFMFDRADDTSPQDGTDHIVFARIVSAPAFFEVQGASQMEIRYDPATAVHDDGSFRFINREIVFGFHALRTVTREPLEGWNAAVWLEDTTSVAIASGQTDSTGFVSFRDAVATATLPATYWMRLSGAQPNTFGKQFQQVAEAEEGTAHNVRWLRITHDGLTSHVDTVDVGNEVVSFLTADLLVRAYHEADDTVGMTEGDNFENADNLAIRLWRNGTLVETKTPTIDGSVTFTDLDVGEDYVVTAGSTVATQVIITDTTEAVQALNGANPAIFQCPLGADTLGTPNSCATFAYKYNNGGVTGTVATRDNTPAPNVPVRVQPSPRMYDGRLTAKDTTARTNANGQYSVGGLLEGPYIVSVADSVTSTGDTIWAVLAPDNRADTIDIEGNADTDIADFTITRGDTEIRGLVVNDRDQDLTVVDPGEALAGVQINLYRDNSGAPGVSADSLVATTTTNAAGQYTFASLFEGRYVVQAESTSEATVLRGFTSTGAVIDTAVAQTSGNPLVRGTHNPAVLPRWDYDNSTAVNVDRTHFTFLYNNTEARGVVQDAGGVGQSGVNVVLRRCDDSAGSTSPPAAGTCTTYFPGFTAQSTTTAADGSFSFTGLQEGVYEVDPAVGAPNAALYRLVGSGDIETATFVTP